MYIYKVTNKINGKLYIGQTIQTIERRWRSHCLNKRKVGISGAIKKYGAENFTIEVIDSASSRDELNAKEIFWIEFLNTMSPNGYNLNSGGNDHVKISDETRERLRESMSGERAPWYGKHLTEETRKKLSESHKGKPGYWTNKRRDTETIAKMRSNRIGKTVGATHCQSMRVLCVETGVIYDSIGESARLCGISRTGVINALKGRAKTAGSYHWKYVD